MARLLRLFLADIPKHIIRRGSNRQLFFRPEEGFLACAHWLAESAKNEVAIRAWASNSGMALGSDKCRQEIEALFSRRVTAMNRGQSLRKWLP
ncbi:MAG: hypothetical protein WCY88_17720 [Spongiibacteraceae bacterium]